MYNGTAEIVLSPERGFRMEIDNGCDIGGITDDQLKTMQRLNLTVAQTYCYLPTAPILNQSTFGAINKAFAKLRSIGAKALWRFAYDRQMPGEQYYTTETILSHIEQLAPVFQQNSDAL